MIKNDLIEGVDYKFCVFSGFDDAGIRILSGKYEGVGFICGNVSFSPENDSDGSETFMHFNFEIIESCDFDSDELNESEDFKNAMGDILTSIITKKLKEDVRIDELGTVNIEESDI